MGKLIKTKDGISIDLNVPAQITSFETDINENVSSHVTRGKLQVFSKGSTGDLRDFTEEFSNDLVKSLPGTPVVAFYDEDESEDFIGHNPRQYVYGYVPEDAVPTFVEKDNKTWAVVDVNLFTERKDNIGEVAKKIIGKAHSLELNPDTVDYKLIYINDKLTKIVFTKGSFYGLSVLGDNQKPAFEGSMFFTENVIDELKSFQNISKDGGNLEMNKTDFLSLCACDKRRVFDRLVDEKKVFDAFYVIDFDEENVYIEACKESEDWVCHYYAAPYTWEGEDNYSIGDFYEVIPSYVKKENVSSNPSNSEEDGISIDGVVQYEENTDANDSVSDDTSINSTVETESPDFEKKESDSDEQENEPDEEDEDEYEEKKKERKTNCETVPTNASTLSNEERSELENLRREKKVALIDQYKEFLGTDTIATIKSKVDEYDLLSLEKELKIQSFDANKNKIQEKESSTFGIVLPTIGKKEYDNAIDRLVAENIKR